MKAKFHVLLTFGLLSIGANALAQSIVVPTVAVDPGQTAVVSLDYVAAATVTNLDFTMSYDETVVDEAAIVVDCSTSIPGLTALNCSVNTTTNQVRGIGVNFGATELSSTSGFAVVSFPVLPGAAVGDSVNAFVANFANVSGGIVSTQNTTWTLTVSPPPQPDYFSVPTPATGIALSGIQNDIDPSLGVLITNAGEATSTLTGSCTETSDPDSLFTISGDTSFSVLAGGPSAVVTVTCDSAGAIGPHTGEMTCTHDGDGTTETSPAVYAMSCNITEGPQPAYSDMLSPSPLNLVAVEQGDANPTGTITVTNTGDVGTTLIGTCSYSGDAEMSLANGGFSLAQNASNVATLTCDATTEGNYNGQISCTHNAGNVASPVLHDVSCAVGPPGPAVYASSPAPGATIDMTPPGDDALVGSADPTSVLQITNNAAELNDRDLVLSNCAFAGSAEITATPVLSPLAPGLSTFVTFTCDTTAAGAFTGTYSCSYDENGDDLVDGTATYTVNCGVREPESDAVVTPASGTALTIIVPIGGSGQTSVRFSEIMDEGADGSLDDCSLDDTTYHSIVSSTTYPQAIPSGGFLDVVVQGNNPGDPLLVSSAVLTCTYSDSDSEATQVSWPIDIVVRAEAIPTLSIGGLLAMVLTLLGLGGIVLRRRMLG
jgi:hypothetical protein